MHFSPTGCSWLNMAGIFFKIITRQAIRRGTFRSVKELTGAVGVFIDAYNDRCRPFTRIKDAGVLMTETKQSRTNATRHWRERPPEACPAWGDDAAGGPDP